MCGCVSRAPYGGPGSQPRHVPWLGIKPVTLWFAYPCSITELHQPWLVCSFLLLSSDSLYGCTTFCLSLLLLMTIYIIYSLGLLKIRHLRIFLSQFLCGQMLSFPSSKRLGIELLSHRVDTSLTLYKTTKQFSKVMVAMRSLFNTGGNRVAFDVVQHSRRLWSYIDLGSHLGSGT